MGLNSLERKKEEKCIQNGIKALKSILLKWLIITPKNFAGGQLPSWERKKKEVAYKTGKGLKKQLLVKNSKNFRMGPLLVGGKKGDENCENDMIKCTIYTPGWT